MEKVSIVVPIYNAERYISNCISSILKQTYTNIEVILVNDGSQDNSLYICEQFKKIDNRIIILNKKNGGVSSARNEGIKIAKGDYLQFVDSDDTLELNFVENLVDNIKFWDAELVICGYNIVENNNKSYVEKNSNVYDNTIAFTREDFIENFGAMLLDYKKMSLGTPWNKLFLRKIIVENNIEFPEHIHYGEDLLFNLQYFAYCNKLIYIKKKLYNYFSVNNQSLEAKFKPDLFQNQLYLYKKIKRFLIDNNKYSGNNIINLTVYYAYRIPFIINNLFHIDSKLDQNEKIRIIQEIVNVEEVKDCILNSCVSFDGDYCNIPEFIRKKDVYSIYALFEQKNRYLQGNDYSIYKEPEGEWDIAFEKAPFFIKLYRYIKYTNKSFREYGVCITLKRIFGKINRKIFRRR